MATFTSNASTSEFNQLTFVWPESDTPDHSNRSVATPTRMIPLGVSTPKPDTSRTIKRESSKLAKNARNGKPVHISDLLLVVLDRYGIDPAEFMAGLE